MDHNDVRETRDPESWSAYQELVVKYLREGPMRLKDKFSEEEINKVIGEKQLTTDCAGILSIDCRTWVGSN